MCGDDDAPTTSKSTILERTKNERRVRELYGVSVAKSSETVSSSFSLSTRALALLGTLVLICWGIVIGYVLHASMPYNPIDLPYQEDISIHVLLPERWAFFTRDPRESVDRYYKKSNGSWENARLGRQASVGNAFGLSRLVRAQGVEAGRLITQIAATAWKDCEKDAETCLNRADVSATLHNPSPTPTLCGTVGVIRREPVPWAWNGSRESIIMPGQVLKMEVQC